MKLLWTEPSVADLRAIRDYIARDSDSYAAGLVGTFRKRAAAFPQAGKTIDTATEIP